MSTKVLLGKGPKGWSTVGIVFGSLGLTLFTLVAVAGLFVGSFALRNTNDGLIGTPSYTVTGNGSLSTDRLIHYLAGTGARAITISDDELALLVNKEIVIYSATAASHVVTLSGGATWSGGTTTIATWPGTIGKGLIFRVLSATSIVIVTNTGSVVFS